MNQNMMNQSMNQTINDTITKLIDNISFLKDKQREKINLILDSGSFNGGYLIGSLYFLKELEQKQYIQIDKISGCSIGSLVAVLYYADILDLYNDLYCMGVDHFRKTGIFGKNKLLNKLKERLPDNICDLVHKKLYISYYDLKKKKKIVRYTYKNKDDIIETIIRSCFFPLLLDNNFIYKNRYTDGLFPYVFPEKNKNDCKNLFLDLYGFDKFKFIFSVKNEKSSFHRILSGLLDTHLFYIKEKPTYMCSYINEWTIVNKIYYKIVRPIIEFIAFYIIYSYYFVKNKVMTRETRDYLNRQSFIKKLFKIIHSFRRVLFQSYFL